MSLVRNEIRKEPTMQLYQSKFYLKWMLQFVTVKKLTKMYGRVPDLTHELEHVQFIMYRMILGSLSVFNNGISL